jgi:hypothetical protein
VRAGTVQATVAACIDRLDPKAKRTLSAAAVVGSRFGADLLTHPMLLRRNAVGRGERGPQPAAVQIAGIANHQRDELLVAVDHNAGKLGGGHQQNNEVIEPPGVTDGVDPRGACGPGLADHGLRIGLRIGLGGAGGELGGRVVENRCDSAVSVEGDRLGEIEQLDLHRARDDGHQRAVDPADPDSSWLGADGVPGKIGAIDSQCGLPVARGAPPGRRSWNRRRTGPREAARRDRDGGDIGGR